MKTVTIAIPVELVAAAKKQREHEIQKEIDNIQASIQTELAKDPQALQLDVYVPWLLGRGFKAYLADEVFERLRRAGFQVTLPPTGGFWWRFFHTSSGCILVSGWADNPKSDSPFR